MNSYDRIYTLLTEVKTPDERMRQVRATFSKDGSGRNRGEWDMEKIKKTRDPNNPLNKESPQFHDVESRISQGRGDTRPDDVAGYIGISHGASKRHRDLAKQHDLRKKLGLIPQDAVSDKKGGWYKPEKPRKTLGQRVRGLFRGKRR